MTPGFNQSKLEVGFSSQVEAERRLCALSHDSGAGALRAFLGLSRASGRTWTRLHGPTWELEAPNSLQAL